MLHGTHFMASSNDQFAVGKTWGPWLWYLVSPIRFSHLSHPTSQSQSQYYHISISITSLTPPPERRQHPRRLRPRKYRILILALQMVHHLSQLPTPRLPLRETKTLRRTPRLKRSYLPRRQQLQHLNPRSRRQQLLHHLHLPFWLFQYPAYTGREVRSLSLVERLAYWGC